MLVFYPSESPIPGSIPPRATINLAKHRPQRPDVLPIHHNTEYVARRYHVQQPTLAKEPLA